jgi:formylglycine-generating enzyme required for sulfatase activity
MEVIRASAPAPSASATTARNGLDFVYVTGGTYFRGGVLEGGMLGLMLPQESASGLRVTSVEPGGPADRAGVRKDDRVIAVAGSRFRGYRELRKFMRESLPEMELDVEVLRDGSPQKLTVTLGFNEQHYKGVQPVELKGFWLGATEVTQAQWEAVMGSNPSFFKGPDRPVENISWNEAQAFITKLNRMTGGRYRLPTEAEWEYAARSAGKIERWAGTSDPDELENYAWVQANSGGATQPVAGREPNGLGLNDRTGNVAELCNDWLSYSYHRKSPIRNPPGPRRGSQKVVRGGDWSQALPDRNDRQRGASPGERKSGLLGLRLAAGGPPEGEPSNLGEVLRFRRSAGEPPSAAGPGADLSQQEAEEPVALRPPDHVDPVTGMEFVRVSGGSFEMGDRTGYGSRDERPVHRVVVSDFHIGRHEVTQAQWEKVMGVNPATFKDPNRPAESVRWAEIVDFIEELNLRTGQSYRLPTEAEWEYAARGGGNDDVWAGTSSETKLRDYAWDFENRHVGPRPTSDPHKNNRAMLQNIRTEGFTHPVGLGKPNRLGLFDMSGNVWEWCSDRYDPGYYHRSTETNPQGAAAGQHRVLRGGYYNSGPVEARSAERKREGLLDSSRSRTYGFRLVLPIEE